MTYIAAFRCLGGISVCADTQETVNGEKQYSEKLVIPQSGTFPIAIGGAGLDELIEAFSQELLERVANDPPRMIADMRTMVKESINNVYTEDVPISVIPRQYRTPEFIVAAKPTEDDFAIFRLKGKRIFEVQKHVIIGYATVANKIILERMYRESITLAQGAILGAYLVAQSKMIDEGVGFDTRIATVASHGAFIEDRQYVSHLESRANEVLRLFDDLFLAASDSAIHDFTFDKTFEEFGKSLRELRQKYIRETSMSLYEKVCDINWQGDAYAKLPDSSMSVRASNRCIIFRDGKQSLMLPDGYTEDGRAKMKLVPLNSPEAQGQTSWELPIPLVGVSIEQMAKPEGLQLAQKTLSDNADRLRHILRSDKNTALGWKRLPVRNPSDNQRSDSEQSNKA